MASNNDACAPDGPTMGRGTGATRRDGVALRGRPRYWTDDRIAHDLDWVLKSWSGRFFPTARQLRHLGRGDLASAIEVHGGFAVWAGRLGMPLRLSRDRRPYDPADAKADALEVIDELGVLPGDYRLKKRGKVRLASYLANQTDGRHAFLRSIGFGEAEATRLTDLSHIPRARKWTDEHLGAELSNLLAGLREWPPDSFFIKAGRTDLLGAANYHGGKRTWARRIGLAYRRPGRSY